MVLDRAVNALGGADELRAIEVVRVQADGPAWPRLQMATPEPPFEDGRMYEDVLLDIKGSRLRSEQRNWTPGFENPDTSRRLELIDIGPNAHAREMLVACLPQERVVFQADVFGIPSNEAPFGPPREPFVSFAKKLKELRLKVERIASVHGRTATIEEFHQRMNAPGPGT